MYNRPLHRLTFAILAAVATWSLCGCDVDAIEAFLDGTGAVGRHPWLASVLRLLEMVPLVLVAGAVVIYVARRALLRGKGQTAPPQPRGYRMGYFFIIANMAFGLLVGVLFAAMLGLGSKDEIVSRVPTWWLLAANGLVGMITGVAALVRRHPACYLAIVIALTVNVTLYVIGAASWLYMGQWLTAIYCAAVSAINCAWLVYFGNRKHQFGYMRGPSEQLDVVQD